MKYPAFPRGDIYFFILKTLTEGNKYKRGGIDIAEDVSYNNVAKLNPFRYRGCYYDEETNLYYLQSRYYDPTVCRFINADDVAYIAPETLNGLNVFAYCGNNPVMRVDANGNAWWGWLIGALVVVALAVGTIISAGGLGIGLMALGAAVQGMAIFGTTTTALAFATVGAFTAFAATAVVAGIESIASWTAGNSFATGFEVAMGYGEAAMRGTTAGALSGFFGG